MHIFFFPTSSKPIIVISSRLRSGQNGSQGKYGGTFVLVGKALGEVTLSARASKDESLDDPIFHFPIPKARGFVAG